jgi:RNA polymerase sigma-70 factor, ECF subfamily
VPIATSISPVGLPVSADALVKPPARPSLATMATAELTRRMAAGEEAAFREFHARYFDRLYQFVLVVARGNQQEAEEAVQDTLVRVARYVRMIENEETLWCWLKSVARSAARDAGRKQTRYARLLERFGWRWKTLGADSTPAADPGLTDLLEQGLGCLEADERRLIEGRYGQGATIRELAHQTGLSERAVESRLVRLRRHLREHLLRQLSNHGIGR